MRRRSHRFWPVLVVALLVGCGGRRGLDVTKGEWHGLETVTVENPEVRVTFVPALGGRLIEYTLRRTGTNQLWVNPEFVPPENVTHTYGYGGLDDHLTLEGEYRWPARLPLESYACDVTACPDNVTVTLTWGNPAWKLERTHVLFDTSTRLHTTVTMTNLDNEPRELTPHPHPTFAVGGDATGGDCVFTHVDTGLYVHRHTGALDRDIRVSATDGWAGTVDTKTGQAVLLLFDRDEVTELNLWFSEDSCNVEPIRTPAVLACGESCTMGFDMFILPGKDPAAEVRALPVGAADDILSALDTFAKRKGAVAALDTDDFYLASWGTFRLELSRVVSTDGEPLSLTARLAAFDAEKPVPTAKVFYPGGEKGVRNLLPVGPEGASHKRFLTPFSIEPVRAPGGNHEVWVFTVPTDKLDDGTHPLVVDVGAGETRCLLALDVVTAGKLCREVEALKAVETDRLRPRYAAARFYLDAAGRTGLAPGCVPAAPSLYAEIRKYLSRSRDALAGNVHHGPTGSFPRFYTSRIDDSAQGYMIHVPLGYTSERKWPLIVWLHGRGSGSRPFDPEPHDAIMEHLADRFALVLVRPHGRGNTGYRGAGADDVLTVIEQVCADYNIDPDCVTLTGGSMGGGGTWELAVRYPDRFAAIGPVYGPVSRWLSAPEPEKCPPWLRFRLDARSTETVAENLRYTPAYVYHGVKDETVSVEHSRRMVARLRELGFKHIYEEDPTGIHSIPEGLPERIWDFLLEHRRQRSPRTVVHRSPYLRFGRAWWVQMDAFAESMTFGEIRAEAKRQSIDVTQKNLTAFTLELDRRLVDPDRELTVVIDGHSAFAVAKGTSGKVSFHLRADPDTEKPRWTVGRTPGPKPGARVKTSDVEGPMSDVFRSRFILVVGTAGDDRSDEACREAAEWFNRERWRKIQQVDCIVRTDAQLTPEERHDANLVLIGGPDVNTVTRELAPGLPVTFGPGGELTVDGKTLPGPGGAVALVHPNPTSPERYVLLFAGTSPEATRRVVRTADLECDYVVLDDKTTDKTDSALLFGTFDQQWKFDKRTQWGRSEANSP